MKTKLINVLDSEYFKNRIKTSPIATVTLDY